MNRYSIIPGSLRYGSRSIITAVLAIAILTCTTNIRAAMSGIAWSTFDGTTPDFDGWVGRSCVNPGLCSFSVDLGAKYTHQTIGGVGDSGYIRGEDPSSETAARVFAPSKFVDALHEGAGQVLKLSANAVDVDGSGEFDPTALVLGAPLVTIEYGFDANPLDIVPATGATLVYVIPSSEFPTKDGTWAHYMVPLDATDDGWLYFDNSDPAGTRRDATSADFTAILAEEGKRLTAILEWLNDSNDLDTGGLDNIHLVPVPAALPLMMSALLGLGFAARRRS